jgi:hypothetical protein
MVPDRGCFAVGASMAPRKSTCGPLVRHSYVIPRGSGIAFHRAGTGERAPRGRAHVYDAGRAGIAGPPKRNLSQFVLSRASCHGQSSGWPISLDKIVNPPEGDNVVA